MSPSTVSSRSKLHALPSRDNRCKVELIATLLDIAIGQQRVEILGSKVRRPEFLRHNSNSRAPLLLPDGRTPAEAGYGPMRR